jgi:hypothetical protein
VRRWLRPGEAGIFTPPTEGLGSDHAEIDQLEKSKFEETKYRNVRNCSLVCRAVGCDFLVGVLMETRFVRCQPRRSQME